MKKFLLSLAVLFAGVASAQTFYMEGERLSEFNAGTQYLLGSDDDGGRYLSEDGESYLTSEIPTKAALIEFQEAGKTEAGEALYYIKFSETGNYIADQEMWDGWDLSDMLEWKMPYIAVTSDVTKAAKWTVLPASKREKAEIKADGSHVANWRVWTGQGDDDTEVYENAWVIMRDRLSDPNPVEDEPLGGQNPVYLEVQGQYAFFAMWGSNSWFISEPEELDSEQILGEYLEAWVDEELDGVDVITLNDIAVGAYPGQYTEESWGPFYEAYQAYQTWKSKKQGDAGAILEALKATYPALEKVLMSEGYYYIHSFAPYSGSTRVIGVAVDGYLSTTPNFEVPVDTVDNLSTATVETAPYLWYLTPSEEKPGALVFQHVTTSRYVVLSSENGNLVTTTEAEEAEPFFFEIVPDQSGNLNYQAGCTYLYGTNEAGQENSSWNQQNTGRWGVIYTWKKRDDIGNQWKFVNVDAEKVLPVLDAAVQHELNNQLSVLYSTSVAAYKDAAPTFTADDDFSTHGYINTSNITAVDAAGGDPIVKNESVGTIAGMLDGDVTTFVHTAWSGSTYPHYFDIDLGNGNELDSIVLKTIPRRDSDHNSSYGLGVVGVYVRNAVDAEWTFVNDLTLNYNINLNQHNIDGTVKTDSTGAPVPDAWGAMNGEKFVGVGDCALGGKYRYIRLEHKVTKGMKDGTGTKENTYAAIAELALFGSYGAPKFSMLSLVPAEVVANFSAEIENARAAIAAQNATEEGIAALQAAYDAFIENYPVPARLKAAIDAAKTFAENAPVDDAVGYYPTAAKAALVAVIAEVEATLKNVMPIADIEAGIAKLDAAKAAFMKTLNMPKTGYYQIYVDAAKYKHAILYASTEAVDTEEQQGLMAHFMKAEMDTTSGKPIYDARYTGSVSSVWYVEVQGTQMAFRSVANGLYWQKNLDNGAKVQLAHDKVFFDVQADGVKNGQAYNFVVGEDSVTGDILYANINSAENVKGGQLVSWFTADGADNSTFRMQEVKLDDFEFGVNTFVLGEKQTKFMTFAYDAVYYAQQDGAALYEPLGFFELEPNLKAMYFQELPIGTVIEAGKAYLARTRGTSTYIKVELEEQPTSIDEFNYDYVATSNNGLAGTIFTTEIGNDYGVFGYGGLIVPSSNTENEEGEVEVATVAPYSGYIDAGTMTILDAVPTPSKDAEGNELKIARLVTRYGVEGLNAIEGVETVETTQTGAYTLSGVRLNSTKNLPAGIYIINGKKVVK